MLSYKISRFRIIFTLSVLLGATGIIFYATLSGHNNDNAVGAEKAGEKPLCREKSDQRYANVWQPEEKPVWRPESSIDLANAKHPMYEITRYPDCLPTQDQYEQAWQIYKTTYKAVDENGWFSLTKAEADGFYKVAQDPIHWANSAYTSDGSSLNPRRPENLVYLRVPGEDKRILAGVMYWRESIGKQGRQFGGPLTVWHYHPFEGGIKTCLNAMWAYRYRDDKSRTAEDIAADTKCSEDAPQSYRGTEMIHVWFIEHPEGPFASRMGVPDSYLNKIESGKPEMMDREEFMTYAKEKFRKYYLGKRAKN